MIPLAGQWVADVAGHTLMVWLQLRGLTPREIVDAVGASPTLASRIARMTLDEVAAFAATPVLGFLPRRTLAEDVQAHTDDPTLDAQRWEPLDGVAAIDYLITSWVRERVLADPGSAIGMFHLTPELALGLRGLTLDQVRRLAYRAPHWTVRALRTSELRAALIELGGSSAQTDLAGSLALERHDPRLERQDT
jgi:hypothetical protein